MNLDPTPNTVTHRITTDRTAIVVCRGRADKIGRIATNGTITEFALPNPTPGGAPLRHRGGSGRKPVVHGDPQQQGGMITTAGAITEFTVGITRP
jgi:hypothetical protein